MEATTTLVCMEWQEKEDVEEIIYDMRLSCQVNAFNGLGVLWMNERRWDVIKRRWWLHCMMLLKFIPLAAPPHLLAGWCFSLVNVQLSWMQWQEE